MLKEKDVARAESKNKMKRGNKEKIKPNELQTKREGKQDKTRRDVCSIDRVIVSH